MSHAATPPKINPTAPPATVSVEASKRNCQRISLRRAPSAFRTPISRVRSVTEIIMMAITPTPPTRRATEDRPSMTMKKTPVILLNVSRICSWRMMAKLFGSAGRSRRMERMAPTT